MLMSVRIRLISYCTTAGILKGRRQIHLPRLTKVSDFFRSQKINLRDKQPNPTEEQYTRTVNGVSWRDDFSWMESKAVWGENVRIQQHLTEEQDYLETHLTGAIRALQRRLKIEFQERLPSSQLAIPERLGMYSYASRQTTNAPAVCFFRNQEGQAEEEVVLDANQLREEDGNVHEMKLSPDQSLLAYTLSGGDGGGEVSQGAVRHITSGRIWAELPGVCSMEWCGNQSLLTTIPDHLGRPFKVFQHSIGRNGAGEGVMIFEEPDPERFVQLTATKDAQYACINSSSKTSSEVWLVDSADPSAPPLLVEPRTPGLEYAVEHREGLLYILTNLGDPTSDYSLVTSPVSAPRRGNWQVLLPARPGYAIEDMDLFQGCAVLQERREGLPGISILQLPTDAGAGETASRGQEEATPDKSFEDRILRRVALPEWASDVDVGANLDFHAASFRVTVSSPLHLPHLFDVDLQTGKASLLSQQEFQRSSDSDLVERLECHRLWAVSSDGTKVPVTVVSQMNLAAETGPCLVEVYGAYGECLETGFGVERLSLLERGWTLAFAHVRGGGELGRRWHEEGRKRKKVNSVLDLEAVLDLLVARRFAEPGRTALHGTSAGGFIAAAVLNRRPGMFGAAVLRVPFVDALTALCDPELPLTQHEYEEWGDPNDTQDLLKLMEICPYQNIRTHATSSHPPVLVTCAADDTRVPFWGPLKYAAKLRLAGRKSEQLASQTFEGESAPVWEKDGLSGGAHVRDRSVEKGGASVLVQFRREGGHLGQEEDILDQQALEYALLISWMGGPAEGKNLG